MRSGISDLDGFDRNIHVWPNPARDILFLQFNDSSFGPTHIAVYDVLGNIVKKEEFDGKIDVTDLSNGVYIVRVSGSKESLHKVVINR